MAASVACAVAEAAAHVVAVDSAEQAVIEQDIRNVAESKHSLVATTADALAARGGPCPCSAALL